MSEKKPNKKTIAGGDMSAPFAKNCRLNGEWVIVDLNSGELLALEQKHRQDARQVMRECLEDAGELGLKNQRKVITASALFDKRCHSVYTVIQNALDEKVRLERMKKASLPLQHDSTLPLQHDSNAKGEGKSSSYQEHIRRGRGG